MTPAERHHKTLVSIATMAREASQLDMNDFAQKIRLNIMLGVLGGLTAVALIRESEIIATCKCCGHQWFELPSSARTQNVGDPLDGAYWECTCTSTLFVPKKSEDTEKCSTVEMG